MSVCSAGHYYELYYLTRYVYGHRRFTKDIETMTGVRPGLYWQVVYWLPGLCCTGVIQAMWRVVSPCLMAVVLVSSCWSLLTSPATYTAWNRQQAAGETRQYPGWALGLAGVLATSSLLPVLAGALTHLVRPTRASKVA